MSFKIPTGVKVSSYELILTENCNMRCKYCFDNTFSDRTGCNYDTTMSLDKIDEIFAFILKTRNKETNPLHLVFFGGEPTVNFEFIKEFVKRWHGEIKIPIDFSINTNGLDLNKEKIDFLITNNIHINLSLDGIRESHNMCRVDAGGNPTWNKVVKNLPYMTALANKYNTRITTALVVNSSNIDYFYESYRFFDEMHVNINILEEYESGNDPVFMEKYEKALRQLFLVENRRVPVVISSRMYDKNYVEKASSFCRRPEGSVTIAPNGNIYVCHRFVPKMLDKEDITQTYCFGNMKDGYTNHEQFDLMSKRVNFDFKDSSKCKNCSVFSWCKGGCVAHHMTTTKNFDNLAEGQCNIMRLFGKIFNITNGESKCHIAKI